MALLTDVRTSAQGRHAEGSGIAVNARKQRAATVVEVGGGIDATNSDLLTQNISGITFDRSAVVVGMTGVEFIGVQGMTALMKINDQCQAAGVCWVLVPGDWVGHLLDSADRDHVLPAA